MSAVAAFDVSHVRFGVPHLATMRTFLSDFGLAEVSADGARLFSRGYEGFAFAHACELHDKPDFSASA